MKILEDYQLRVFVEHGELYKKTIRLNRFLNSKDIINLSNSSRILLKQQYKAMREYLDILAKRISEWIELK